MGKEVLYVLFTNVSIFYFWITKQLTFAAQGPTHTPFPLPKKTPHLSRAEEN